MSKSIHLADGPCLVIIHKECCCALFSHRTTITAELEFCHSNNLIGNRRGTLSLHWRIAAIQPQLLKTPLPIPWTLAGLSPWFSTSLKYHFDQPTCPGDVFTQTGMLNCLNLTCMWLQKCTWELLIYGANWRTTSLLIQQATTTLEVHALRKPFPNRYLTHTSSSPIVCGSHWPLQVQHVNTLNDGLMIGQFHTPGMSQTIWWETPNSAGWLASILLWMCFKTARFRAGHP